MCTKIEAGDLCLVTKKDRGFSTDRFVGSHCEVVECVGKDHLAVRILYSGGRELVRLASYTQLNRLTQMTAQDYRFVYDNPHL